MAHSPLTVLVSTVFIVIPLSAQAQVTFFQPPTFAGAGTVFAGDLNGDGKADLITSDGTVNLGIGDGTFRSPSSVGGLSGPIVALADFNGDGKLDLLESRTGTLVVHLGNGDGTLQSGVATSIGATLTTVAVGDLNGDGKPDVVGVFGSSLLVYLGNGDGTFAAGVSYAIGSSSYSYSVILLGDFNGDRKTDVFVNISSSPGPPNQALVFLGNGDGTFQATPKSSNGVVASVFAVAGDFNNDGNLDVVLTAATSSCSMSNCNATLLLGNGDGTFQSPATVFSAQGAIAAADANGDGKLDLVANTGIVQIFLGNGDGTFSNGSNYAALIRTLSGPVPSDQIAVADLNGDGKLDIVATDTVLLGSGTGLFSGVPIGVFSAFGVPVVGDFNNDGAPDVAALSVSVPTSSQLSILKNSGTSLLTPSHTYTLQPHAYGAVTADVNGDGVLDLVVFATPTSSQWGYSVLLGNGDGSFQAPIFYPQSIVGGLSPGGSSWFVVTDFNNDHVPDIALTMIGSSAATSNSLAILLGHGDGTFAPPIYYYNAGFRPLRIAGDTGRTVQQDCFGTRAWRQIDGS